MGLYIYTTTELLGWGGGYKDTNQLRGKNQLRASSSWESGVLLTSRRRLSLMRAT